LIEVFQPQDSRTLYVGASRLLGQLGDMSHESLLTALVASWNHLTDSWAEKLCDEATSALALIRAREQQHQDNIVQGLPHAENFDANRGYDLHVGAGSADNVDEATGAVVHASDEETKLEQEANQLAEVLRESEQHADQQEGASLAEALLRSKIDMQAGSEVVLLRLTTYSDEVDTVLLESP